MTTIKAKVIGGPHDGSVFELEQRDPDKPPQYIPVRLRNTDQPGYRFRYLWEERDGEMVLVFDRKEQDQS